MKETDIDYEALLISWAAANGVNPDRPLGLMRGAVRQAVEEARGNEFGPVCPLEAFEAGVKMGRAELFNAVDTREWNEIVIKLWNRWKPSAEQAPCQICERRVRIAQDASTASGEGIGATEAPNAAENVPGPANASEPRPQ